MPLAAWSAMANSSHALDTPLRDHMAKLAAFEPQDAPVLSLYLNLTPDSRGRDNYDAFLRKAFAEHLKPFAEHSPERASLDRDVERVNAYLADEVHRSSNGLALFASAGSGEFFEAVQLEAPMEEHWLVSGAVPHLYPLARLVDQYPRYAAVLLDTNRARILVFALGALERREQVAGVKTRRSSMGGWSQARYQRRAENFHLHHVKEVADTLDRIVRQENIRHIIVAGDDVAVALLRDRLPPHLVDKLVDVLRIDRNAGDSEIVEATLEALRQKDAETDAERVQEAVNAWQSGGLGAVGPESVLSALQLGQVDELLITGAPHALKTVQKLPDDAAPDPVVIETSGSDTVDMSRLQLADELVTRAEQTGASVRIIEEPSLLEPYGGVAALLRFRV
jgi:peptide subunit release factor 1 (eRF1)